MTVSYFVSTITDGSMKSPDRNFATVLNARTTLLQSHDIQPTDTTLVQVTYEGNDYCRYVTLNDTDKGDGITRVPTIESDALVVTRPGHALLLPLADCIGVVIHDTKQNVLMVSHLGRHNLEQLGGTKCIEYLAHKHHSNPADLTVWLSPAAGREHYPLFTFDNRSLYDVAIEQLEKAGVPQQTINTSPSDSAADPNYFSHSQYLQGKRDTDGRFAIVAVLNS